MRKKDDVSPIKATLVLSDRDTKKEGVKIEDVKKEGVTATTFIETSTSTESANQLWDRWETRGADKEAVTLFEKKAHVFFFMHQTMRESLARLSDCVFTDLPPSIVQVEYTSIVSLAFTVSSALASYVVSGSLFLSLLYDSTSAVFASAILSFLIGAFLSKLNVRCIHCKVRITCPLAAVSKLKELNFEAKSHTHTVMLRFWGVLCVTSDRVVGPS